MTYYNDEALTELAHAVMDHATKNYESGEGWDYIVECWTIENIKEKIGDVRTLYCAIRTMEEYANRWAEMLQECSG